MNILYLIGNGFDLAQGLKTSYQDFYDYLKTQTPVNSIAALMLEHIKGPEVELWKDLELKLGEFTSEVSDKDQFEEFYYDLCEKLRGYLVEQADSFSPKKEVIEKYIKDLVSPFEYLNEREKNEIRKYYGEFADDRIIDIISFNYTDVLDRAIDAYNTGQNIPSTGYHYRLQPIMNVHGRLSTSYLLMGVNDISQIQNPLFADDENVWDYLVKPQSNLEIGSLVDSRAEDAILKSNLIVAMGLSFAETDSNWWKIVGARLRRDNDIRIILFEFVKDLYADERKHQPLIRNKRKEFLLKCGIEESKHTDYVNKIFVRLNQGLFSPNTVIFNDNRKGW